MTIPADLKTAVPLAGSLALYFYFKPNIWLELEFLFFGSWLLGFVLDVSSTLQNSALLHHEKNLIFPILFSKFGPRLSPIVQFFIEFVVMLSLNLLFERHIEHASLSTVAIVFAAAHFEAYLSNICVLAKLGKKNF
jgi:hypothetical protein